MIPARTPQLARGVRWSDVKAEIDQAATERGPVTCTCGDCTSPVDVAEQIRATPQIVVELAPNLEGLDRTMRAALAGAQQAATAMGFALAQAFERIGEDLARFQFETVRRAAAGHFAYLDRALRSWPVHVYEFLAYPAVWYARSTRRRQ